ncbi:MAG: hypothetical protein LBE67_04705 [Kocuria palustris]|nr:hypothetical protein [Kocuria palustris]
MWSILVVRRPRSRGPCSAGPCCKDAVAVRDGRLRRGTTSLARRPRVREQASRSIPEAVSGPTRSALLRAQAPFFRRAPR